MSRRLNKLKDAINIIAEEIEKRHWRGCKSLADQLFPNFIEMIIEDEKEKEKDQEYFNPGLCNNVGHCYQSRYSECFGGDQIKPQVEKIYLGDLCVKCGNFIHWGTIDV